MTPHEPTPTPARIAPPKSRTATPLLLSVAVYPGAGQLLQRRWVAGAAYATAYTLAFGGFLVKAWDVVKAYYAFALDFDHAPGVAPGWRELLLPFLLSVAVYLAGVADTAVAAYRAARRT
jgi:hypothetical protein